MYNPVPKTTLIVILIIFLLPGLSPGQRDTLVKQSDSLVTRHDSLTKEPFFLTFNLGAYNVFRGEYIQGLFEVEFYPRWKAWFFYPFAGAFVNTDTKACLFAGITIPIQVKKRLFFRISFAPGLYTATNEKKDLGFLLEFRTTLKLAWVLPNEGRLGIQFSHISNADIGDKNPGSETLVISYEMPLGISKNGK